MAGAMQGELDFQARTPSGFDTWRVAQRRLQEELARSLGLPLGKDVEVWLRGGVRLRGQLRLEQAPLVHAQSTLQNTRFEVSGVPFYYAEMESCVGI